MGSERRVLVIDDDRDIRTMIGDVLRLEGYDAPVAADGLAGLDAMRKGGPPALILLDMMMPGMNGWDFLAHLHADPAAAATPVVLITGGDLPPDQLERLGAATSLRKPVELDALLAVVRRYCT